MKAQGRALLPRIQRVMDDIGAFRIQAQTISKGIEAEIVLVVESFLPLSMIAPALRRFHAEFPMVQLRINAVPSQNPAQHLLDHQADLGLFLLMSNPQPNLDSLLIAEIDFVAVAAPEHPLAKLPPLFPNEAMRDHLQIVVSDPKTANDGTVYGVVGVDQWRVSDVRLRNDLVKQGIGWGSMPRPMVEADLARGDLVELRPAQWDSSDTMPRFKTVVARHKDKALGPAGSFLRTAIAQFSFQTPF
ncbi:MAG: LysR family transcriptional regulator [Marinosulfonomonas sp.]